MGQVEANVDSCPGGRVHLDPRPWHPRPHALDAAVVPLLQLPTLSMSGFLWTVFGAGVPGPRSLSQQGTELGLSQSDRPCSPGVLGLRVHRPDASSFPEPWYSQAEGQRVSVAPADAGVLGLRGGSEGRGLPGRALSDPGLRSPCARPVGGSTPSLSGVQRSGGLSAAGQGPLSPSALRQASLTRRVTWGVGAPARGQDP